jgi:hypothetical protein
MQVLCKASSTTSDIKCDVCGQDFKLYWERTNLAERDASRAQVMEALRAQHANSASADAHEQCFNLPQWNGLPKYSGAALLGNAPSTVFQVA